MDRVTLVRRLLVAAVGVMAMCALGASGASAARSNEATVTIVHGLPNFTADIYVNDDLLLDGFRPKEVAGPLQLPPGTYVVDIREVGAAAASEPVLSDRLEVPPRVNVSVVAHLDGSGEARLSVFSNDFEAVPAGRSLLVVRSVAEAPTVTVSLDGRAEIRGLASGDEGSAVVDPGRREIEVEGGPGVALRPQNVPLPEGGGQIVYLVGSAGEETLDLMVQSIDDVATPPSGVLTGTGGLVGGSDDQIRWPVLVLLLSMPSILWALTRKARRGRSGVT